MKKYLILVTVAFAGCAKPVILKDETTATLREYTRVTIDGCEYIAVERNPETQHAIFAITHKGNCTNH